MAGRLVNNIEALMLETKLHDVRVLLRRMVDEFDLVYTGQGDACGYCGGWDYEHKDSCAWLVAKQYIEGLKK